jgi:hypothetical protein
MFSVGDEVRVATGITPHRDNKGGKDGLLLGRFPSPSLLESRTK